jgi:hypothetical protein
LSHTQGTGQSEARAQDRYSVPYLPEIQRILRARPRFLDGAAGRAVADLSRFLGSVQMAGLTEAYARLAGESVSQNDPLIAVENTARLIAVNLEGADAPVFRKALEEALLDAAGLDYDLDHLDVDRGLKTYLDTHHLCGFIESFLGLFVFQSIWMSVHDDLRRHIQCEKDFLDLMAALLELSRSVVAEVVQPSVRAGELERGVSPDTGAQMVLRIRDRILRRG